MAWVKELRAEEVSAQVTTSMLKNEICELQRGFSASRPNVNDAAGLKWYKVKRSARCQRFLMRSRMSIRAVTRHGQKMPKGRPRIARKPLKEFRGIGSDSNTVNVCDGEAEGEGMGAAPDARVVKFSLHQTFNIDETPILFEPAGKRKLR